MPLPVTHIGIDSGGTRCRLAVHSPGEDEVHRFDGPGANLQRDGLQTTVQILADHIEKAVPDTSRLRIFAGVAGAGSLASQQALAASMQLKLGSRCTKIRVTTDAEIAFLAAHGDASGVLLIAGTGSILWARDREGRLHRAGGWGYLLGDQGGGYHIGLAGLQAVADAFDGGPPTRLHTLFCETSGLCSREDLINATYQTRTPPQSFAPYVLDAAAAGDEVATLIVHRQVEALVTRLQWLVASTPPFELAIALSGGLTKHPGYRQGLIKAIQDLFPGSRFVDFTLEPAEAALYWIEREEIG